MKLKGKVAIVTGSSRGIGAEIAKLFAKEGAKVVVTYNRSRDKAEQVVNEILTQGGLAIGLHLLVQDRNSVLKFIDDIHKKFGRIDILVNNAAILYQKDFMTISDDEWDEMFAVNMKGTFICTQESLKEMLEQKSGKIINISSIGGQWGGQLAVHYAATKAALISFTQSMAKLYSQYNVQTNCIAPGLVSTEMSAKELCTDVGKEKLKNIPANRLGTVEDIANTAVFLASEDSSYITGQTINLNGGMFFRS